MSSEDVLVPPAAYRRAMHLRRGGWFADGAPPVKPGEFLTEHRERAEIVLRHDRTHPELREAGLKALADPASASPRGTAALVAAAVGGVFWDDAPAVAGAAASFVAARGVPFLAHTALDLAGISTSVTLGRGGDDVAGQWLRVANPGHVTLQYSDVKRSERFAAEARARLATASEADHAAAEALAVPYRTAGHPAQRLAALFLFPHRQDWLEEDLSLLSAWTYETMPYLGVPVLASMRTVDQLERVIAVLPPWLLDLSGPTLPTLLDGLGNDLLPVLLRWCDDHQLGADIDRRLVTAISVLPTDEAYTALLDRAAAKHVLPALREATDRFPRRALRMLARSGARVTDDLLRIQVTRLPALAQELLPELPPAAASRVRAILADTDAVDAPVSRLPAVLVSPPWSKRKRAAKPVVITGLTPDLPDEARWEPGERERFAESDYYQFRSRYPTDFDALAARIRTGQARYNEEMMLFAKGPDELALPLLGTWSPRYVWSAESWLPVVLARHGADALPAAIRIVQSSGVAVPSLMPFVGVDLAVVMAGWFARTKTMREPARAWLRRHPAAAARALIPAAVGKAGAARREAETALRALDRTRINTEAQRYGPEVAAAVESMLDTDPLDVLPAKIPSVDWADPATLPRVALRDGSGVLPVESARHLLTMLAISRPGEVYPGLPIALELLDRADLAVFGWGLFRRWQTEGLPSKDGWALDALRWIGDDDTVRRLAPVIRAWPGEGGHLRAVTGLDVLAAIGTDVALMHLHGISQKVKFKALRERAVEKIAEVAAALDLTTEQLADRLVPDLGLAADGSLRLPHGTREFVVGFDEQLKPYVTDDAGKRLKSLPKAATEAAARFSALKKDVRTLAGDQLLRLEKAMVDGRRWSGAEFRTYFAEHPLLWHLARRLVWAVYDGDVVAHGFRIAEDRSLSDLDDAPLTVADDAVVGLPHPLELGDRCAAWAEVFADYEILQPFPQLGREVFTPGADGFAVFHDVEVPTGRVLGMEKRGWRRGEPQDAGIQGWIEREVRGGRTVVVDLSPGIPIGYPADFEDQRLETPYLGDGVGQGWWPDDKRIPLDRLDPVTASELFRDLTELTGRS
ncbi:DUF4132 domain-containing protein [Catenuloplanes japonicus]|uniref:DUF4132 domain-containing protein n=1 Tax=Catenuloplanes japonicus TaxID=33876 RepID=UPI0007C5BDC6|nr:DUF4132 domain-containing protein [Catenuloplanes japonicus]